MYTVKVKDRMGQRVVSIPRELWGDDFALGDRFVVVRLPDGSLLLRPFAIAEPAILAALGVPA